MGIIEDAHKALIEEVGLCYVATASSDGEPNVSPKGSIMVIDDDHLAFAEIMSPGSRANLEQNARVAIYVCKPEIFQGFQFKGSVELTQDGPIYDRLAAAIKEKGLKLPPIKNAVKIKVEEVRGLGA
ncbi:MAG: pyridoxamine 5'-phosphate oxidase family protein [bacterium]|nr:pyridoxamine 5'-phosphate oxidase family protein [bacterium]MCP5068344.1 pyridoxamine 5'-phosphate oxidase family protein [bacterium]